MARNSLPGGTTTGTSTTRVSNTSATTFTCSQRLCPPPSRGRLVETSQRETVAYRRAPGVKKIGKAGAAGRGSAPMDSGEAMAAQ